MDPTIYLDYAAATPVDERVIAAMEPFWREQFYNPSATYLPAKRVSAALHEARGKVAHWIGARPTEIIFTAGGTEANNLAIHGVMRQFPQGNIVVSAVEHEAVLAPAHQYNCREAGVQSDGTVDVQALAAAIDDNTVLVSVMYANNEVGTVQPLSEIARTIESKRAQRGLHGLPLYFHTDACQSGNDLDLHAARLGVDMMTINGGKLYGPKQSGALYVSSGVTLRSEISGGGQERNIRSGTENVAQDVGLAVALDIAQQGRREEGVRLQKLQTQLFNSLAQALPEMVINGSRHRRLPNNVHVTLPGADNERLLFELEEQGILAAAGSACSASDEEPSHVLKAMGLTEAEARASVRFTMGKMTTAEHVASLVTVLRDIAAQYKL